MATGIEYIKLAKSLCLEAVNAKDQIAFWVNFEVTIRGDGQLKLMYRSYAWDRFGGEIAKDEDFRFISVKPVTSELYMPVMVLMEKVKIADDDDINVEMGLSFSYQLEDQGELHTCRLMLPVDIEGETVGKSLYVNHLEDIGFFKAVEEIGFTTSLARFWTNNVKELIGKR